MRRYFIDCKQFSIIVCLLVVFISSNAQNLNNPNKRGPLGTQVNTFSGNLFIPRTDVYVPAQILDLDITFYYNSFLFTEDYGYGKGWTFQYNIRYSHDTVPGGKLILWGDGREDKYDSLPNGGYKTPRGFYNALSQYQPGQLVLTELDGRKFYFDNPAHKRITRMEEPNGNFISFSYSDSLLTSLTNAAGQTISFTYNAAGRLATVIDAIGSPERTYSYTYDNRGNLTEVKDPLNGKLTYSYLVNGPMKSLADKNDNKVDIIYFPDMTIRELVGCNKRLSFSYDTTYKTTIVTDYLPAGNQVTKYTYQILDNISWMTSISGNCCGFNMSFEFDEQGNKTKETDANGNVYTYTYDNNGNMLTMTDPLNQVSTYTHGGAYNRLTSFTDPKGNIYTFQYDAKGNLIQLVAPGNQQYTATYSGAGHILTSTDPKGNVYTYNYDAFGNPTTVTGPNGYSAILAFDGRGNLLSYTDARNNIHIAEYDILNRLKKITDPNNNYTQLNYDAVGNTTSIQNKQGETTWFSYDASNRVVKVKAPLDKQTEITYDGMDNLTGMKNSLGHASSFAYDSRNRLKNVKDPLNNIAGFNYDGNGNLTSVLLPNGQTRNFAYDKNNRLITVSDGVGTSAKFVYDKNGNVTSFTNGTGAITSATYDDLNRVKTITDPLGNSTAYTYDLNGNIITVTDRNGKLSSYTYDGRDRVKTYTNSNGFLITINYDGHGNIIEVKDQNNNATIYAYDNLNRLTTTTYPDGSFTQFGYNKKNRIISARLTDGTVINYQYDSLNRMTAKTLPDGQVYSYGYDILGRVISATNNSGTVAITYDALNRVTSETFDGRVTRYEYNIAGRTQTTIYPDSTVVVREFDPRNRLTSVVKNGISLASYQYNGANLPTIKTFGNGMVSYLQYDAANRLSNLTTGSIQNSSYSYDKEMNKTAINRSNAPELSEQFTYDNGYRLLSYKRGYVSPDSYSYDAVGNRTAASIGGINATYTTNNLNQLTSVNGVNLSYDNRGNLTFDGTFFKTYDAENRLLMDSSSPASVVRYAYDAFGRRVVKTINGSPFKYTYAGAAQIEERDGNTNALLNRTMFYNFLTPVVNEKGNSGFYYHQNEMNSIEAITSIEGNLVEHYQYDVYGKQSRYNSSNTLINSSLAGNRFGFTGQEYDSTSHSNHFFYRNYSPGLGVFNQRDLIGYEDGMGMYQYVGNNPANGLDVWGLQEQPQSCPATKAGQEVNDFYTNLNFFSDLSSKGIELVKGSGLSSLYDEAGKGGKGGIVTGFIDLGLKGVSNYQTQTDGSSTHFERVDANYDVVGSGGGLLAGIGALAVGGPVGLAVGVGTGGLALGDYVSNKTTGKSIRQHTEAPIVEMDVTLQTELNYQNWAEGFGVNEIYEYHDGINGPDYRTPSDRYDFVRHLWENGKGMTYLMWKRSQNLYITVPNGCGGGTRIKVRWVWDVNKGMWVLQPVDPNEIKGPDGVTEKKWVSVKDRLSYTVLFENDSTASAPAKVVRITTPIEPKQDPASFQLGSFGFNNQTFEVPTNTASYYLRLDCRDSTGLFVDITAGYDQINNVAFWELQSIDPITLLPTEDPLAGFLFLQNKDQINYGKGFVNFSIKPLASSQTLDTIGARASIVFDNNEPIETNIWTNTIDAVAPTSSITNLPASTPDTEINLHFEGADDVNGSGLKWYSIYVSDNNGPPELYVANFKGTDTTFRAVAEHLYKFYVSATDSAGNVEALKLVDSVRITDGENVICPGGNITFESNISGTTYQWQVHNGTGFTDVTDGGIYSGANTAALTLTGAPSSMYGYQYRCLVNGTTYSETLLLKFGMTWEGTVSTEWEDPANWSCNSLPDMNTDVIIQVEKPRYPIVSSNATIRSIRAFAGTSVIVKTGYTLTIVK